VLATTVPSQSRLGWNVRATRLVVPMSKSRSLIIAIAIVLILLSGLAYEIISTAPVRGAVHTCAELFTIANRPGLQSEERIAAARTLCTRRYLAKHKLDVADDGQGLVGFPRNLNKNFKAWREGPNVWVCPTNRVGPVYQFVLEDGSWRFDGPVGILRPWGQIIPMADVPALEKDSQPQE
jgi:hypothetical protein